MAKHTAASVETSLPKAQLGFKERASAVKAAHDATKQAIKSDPMTSDLAKKDKLEALAKDTRNKLDGIKDEQTTYERGLRDTIERQLRGNQPADANSVLLRRDAADRVRKITDKQEALDVLNDAIANGDDSMAHTLGNRARNAAWLDVAEVYQGAYPDTADTAAALAYVEANTSGAAHNLSNSITYSAPID